MRGLAGNNARVPTLTAPGERRGVVALHAALGPEGGREDRRSEGAHPGRHQTLLHPHRQAG